MSVFAPLLFALAAAAPHAKTEAPRALVEAAPLRGMLGQLAVRAELPFLGKVALAAGYEQYSTVSERAGARDGHKGESLELLFYPFGFKDYPFFAGAGVHHEALSIGRQRLRDTNSWARTNADELYDTWTNDDSYLSSTATVGYRVLKFGCGTASFRLVRDELMSASSAVVRDDVKSYDPNLASYGRKTVTTALVLHAGVYLP